APTTYTRRPAPPLGAARGLPVWSRATGEASTWCSSAFPRVDAPTLMRQPGLHGPARPAARARPLSRRWGAVAASVLMWVHACTGEQVTQVQVSSITVFPEEVEVVAGEEVQ